mgnify:CR=1 FL=1
MSKTNLSTEEKQQFIDDGFIVIKNAISPEAVKLAKDLLTAQTLIDDRQLLVTPELTTHPSVLGLFNESCLGEIVRNEMGPYPEVISCQIAITPPFDTLGGEPGPHVDGSWSGPIPKSMSEVDPITTRPKDAAKYFGANDEIRGSNDGQLWIDPDRRMSIGSYTALVGVALNDQLVPGNGQLGVMKGCHEAVEEAFKRQRDSGGVIGPEGIDWPRIKESKSGKPFYNGLPDQVRRKAEEMAAPAVNYLYRELYGAASAAGDRVLRGDDGKIIDDSNRVAFEGFKKRYIIGDPEFAIAEIEKYKTELDPSEIICWMHMPGIRGADAQASMELFAKEVMPAF